MNIAWRCQSFSLICIFLTLSLPECLIEFCKVTLTFGFVDEILWCDHSNETSLPVLSHDAICLSKFKKMKFGNLVEICLWPHLAVQGLKELCHEIYQNSKSGSCNQIKWNLKITAQNIKKEGINNPENKKGGTDGQTWRMKRIQLRFLKTRSPKRFSMFNIHWRNIWSRNLA